MLATWPQNVTKWAIGFLNLVAGGFNFGIRYNSDPTLVQSRANFIGIYGIVEYGRSHLSRDWVRIFDWVGIDY